MVSILWVVMEMRGAVNHAHLSSCGHQLCSCVLKHVHWEALMVRPFYWNGERNKRRWSFKLGPNKEILGLQWQHGTWRLLSGSSRDSLHACTVAVEWAWSGAQWTYGIIWRGKTVCSDWGSLGERGGWTGMQERIVIKWEIAWWHPCVGIWKEARGGSCCRHVFGALCRCFDVPQNYPRTRLPAPTSPPRPWPVAILLCSVIALILCVSFSCRYKHVVCFKSGLCCIDRLAKKRETHDIM